MEGGGERGISYRGSGVFSPSSSMGSSSLTCRRGGSAGEGGGREGE